MTTDQNTVKPTVDAEKKAREVEFYAYFKTVENKIADYSRKDILFEAWQHQQKRIDAQSAEIEKLKDWGFRRDCIIQVITTENGFSQCALPTKQMQEKEFAAIDLFTKLFNVIVKDMKEQPK